MDVSKLKVVELRAELASRGLDQKGNKPVLVARLQEAIDKELEDNNTGKVPSVEKKDGDPGEENAEAEAESEPVQEKPATPDEASASVSPRYEPETGRHEEDSSQFASYQEETESESKPGESEVNDESVEQVAEESSEQPRFRDEESRDSDAVAVDETSVQSVLGYDSNSEPAAPVQDPLERDEALEDDKQEPVFDQNSSSNYKVNNGAKRSDGGGGALLHTFAEPESMDAWNQRESDSAEPARRASFHLEDSNAQDALDAEPTLRATEPEKPMEETEEKEKPTEPEAAENKPENDVSMEEKKEKPEKPSEGTFGVENGEVKKEEEPVAVTPSEPRERRRNRWGDAEPVSMDAEPAQTFQDYQDAGQSEESKPSEGDLQAERSHWGGSDEKMEEERNMRKRERSPERRQLSPPRRPDNEPYFDDKDVLLSWYDSDLHMIIDKDNFFSATLLNTDGFGYVWAGVRATYGFEKGKVYYEVKATEFLDASALEDEPNPHVIRVGWSAAGTSLQLGEEPLSYGYGATGKISSNLNFQDYGKPFTRGDVVGCYLDLDANPITMAFTLNGEELGVAYSIEPEEVKGKPLFPHILSKNCAFHVNFGEQAPWATPLPDYTYVGLVPLEDRVSGPKRPERREDCEVIMMVGLPASGKTTWALKYAAENKEKMYNILGTNTLIDKMKVMGLPRRRNYSGRWEGLISKCTRCLNTLLEMGALRRRNYIIDQTNVYPTAQRRKMRGFEGFVRRAVVIVPTDEDLKARTAKREAEEGKDVPDSAVLEMKANFLLPEKDLFDSIEFVELQEEEATTLVKEYNKEGNEAGYESKFQYSKRPRLDEGGRGGDRDRYDRGDRRGGFSPRGYGGRGGRGGYDRGNRNGNYGDRSGGGYGDRRGGYGDGRGGGGYRGDRSGGGGWRDRGGFNSRPRNDERGGWGGPRGGGNWRDNRGGGWGGQNRYSGGKDDRGGRGRDDRSSSADKDTKRPAQNQGGWSQGQGGYQQQGWQGYGNQWGNWGQGYNAQQPQGQQQQQWKGYGQQMGQGWGQQGWGNQNWANWNQQYYNQAYQQGWGQQPQTAVAGATATDTTQQATAATYNYGQAGATPAIGQAAAPWPGYAAGYGTMAGATATQQGAAAANTYTPAQK